MEDLLDQMKGAFELTMVPEKPTRALPGKSLLPVGAAKEVGDRPVSSRVSRDSLASVPPFRFDS
jgi:hypothetical protein